MKNTKTIFVMIVVCAMLMMVGCFSIARYEANIRPDTVKPSALITGKYRLDRIVLSGSYFAEQGGISESDYIELRWMLQALESCEKNEKGKSCLSHYIASAVKSGVGTGIKEWDNPQLFAEFTRTFAKEQPLWRRQIATKLQEYREADEVNDAILKAASITNMVVLYGTAKGLSDMLVHFKKGTENVTNENMKKFGYQNGKEMFDGIFKKDYVGQSFPGRDELSNKMCFDAVQDALLKNYPSVFSTSKDATPVTVLVSFENKFDDHDSYGAFLCCLGWPLMQQVEVTYRVRVVLNATGRSEDDLWNEYADSLLEYPTPVQNCGGVREREMWTSVLFPFSLIGIPGDSDWQKERRFFTTGSWMISKDREKIAKERMAMCLEHAQICPGSAEKLSYEYMKRFIFDSVSDGDIIAALIMRSLNKMTDSK